jgi:hypothetical protein
VLANDSSLSIHSPLLIYTFLAVYGLLTLMLITYVRTKFRNAEKTLKLLNSEWQSAESTHTMFVGVAQEKLAKLAPASPVRALLAQTATIGFDTRNQVVVMGKRGIGNGDIARTCGLQEGEVEVILGISRLQK